MHAYNIEVLPRPFDREDPDDTGWCFGLPPGIAPEQWPLDPNNGFPLMHGFTLLLPEAYRCHGPDLVALSVFGTPCDHSNGGPERNEAIAAALAPDAPEPKNPELAALQRAYRKHHPRTNWMRDILGAAFATILLTADEYAGQPCRPPEVLPCAHRDALERPDWLDIGAAAAMWTFELPRWESEDYERTHLFRFLGEVPPFDLGFDRALRYRPRACDPNAGVPTCERHDPEPTGYVDPYYTDEQGEFREHAWRGDHGDTHIGGTMRTSQGVPRFSPFHLGFVEEFGGFNFGAGRAQLDFKDMRFDWACG